MKNGKLIDKYGTIKYYLNNKLYRENGPAVEWSNGNKFWYLNDKIHREDGPAVEWSDGYKEWWLNGIRVNKYNLFKYRIEKILNESFKI